MTNDKGTNIPGLFYVDGTETYKTPLGTNTVFLLKPVPKKEMSAKD